MARLTWEQVQAPQMNISGLVAAGQTITNSFDRLGAVLTERYAQQKATATGDAIAQELSKTDPDQVGKIDFSTLDPKIDRAELMKIAVDYRRGLTQELGMKEDLLNKQAASMFGEDIVPLLKGAYNGDENAQAQIAARSSEDPLFARFMAQQAPEIFKAYQDGTDDRESIRQAKADEAIASRNASVNEGQLSLSRQNSADARNERNADKAGIAVGMSLADKYSDVRPEDALLKMQKDPAYLALTSTGKLRAESIFTPRQVTASTPTRGELLDSEGYDSKDRKIDKALDSGANIKEAQLSTPTYNALLRAEKNKNVPADIVIANLAKGGFGSEILAKRQLDALLTNVNARLRKTNPNAPAATPGDVQAAMDQWGSPDMSPSSGLALAQRTLDIARARSQGLLADQRADINFSRATFEGMKRSIANQKIDIARWERKNPGAEVPPYMLTKLEELRRVATEMAK